MKPLRKEKPRPCPTRGRDIEGRISISVSVSRVAAKIRRTKLKRKGRGDVKRKAGREKSVVGRQKGRERNLADRAPVTGRRLTDVFQFARPFTDRQKRSLFCKLQIAAAVSQVLPGKTHRQRYFPLDLRAHTDFEIGNGLLIFRPR